MFNKICCEPELCYWGELSWDTSEHPAGALLTTHTLGAHLQSTGFSRSRVISIQQKQQQDFRFTPWSRWRNETIFPLATASTPDKPWLNYVITFGNVPSQNCRTLLCVFNKLITVIQEENRFFCDQDLYFTAGWKAVRIGVPEACP